MVKGPSTYHDLRTAIETYVKSRQNFYFPTQGPLGARARMDPNEFTPRPAVSASAIESVKTDMQGIESRLDNKIEQMTSQLESLTLVVKKSQNQPEARKKEVLCNFCHKPGHYATQCPENEHRNTMCKICGKWGHHESTCRVKKVRFAQEGLRGPVEILKKRQAKRTTGNS